MIANGIWAFKNNMINFDGARKVSIVSIDNQIPEVSLHFRFQGDITDCTDKFKHDLQFGTATFFEVPTSFAESTCISRRKLQLNNNLGFSAIVTILRVSKNVVLTKMINVSPDVFISSITRIIRRAGIQKTIQILNYSLPMTPPPPSFLPPPSPLSPPPLPPPESPPPFPPRAPLTMSTFYAMTCTEDYGLLLQKTNSTITSGIFNNTFYPYEYEVFLYANPNGSNYPLYQIQASFFLSNYSRPSKRIGLKIPFKEWEMTFENISVGDYWTSHGVLQSGIGIANIPNIPTTVQVGDLVSNVLLTVLDTGEIHVTSPAISAWKDQVLNIMNASILSKSTLLNINGTIYAPVMSYSDIFTNISALRQGFLPTNYPTDSTLDLTEIMYIDIEGYGEHVKSITEGFEFSLIRGVSKWDNLMLDTRRNIDIGLRIKQNYQKVFLPTDLSNKNYCLDRDFSHESDTITQYEIYLNNSYTECMQNLSFFETTLTGYLNDSDVSESRTSLDTNYLNISSTCSESSNQTTSSLSFTIFNMTESMKGFLSNSFEKNMNLFMNLIQ